MKALYFRALSAAAVLSAVSDRAYGGIERDAASGARTLKHVQEDRMMLSGISQAPETVRKSAAEPLHEHKYLLVQAIRGSGDRPLLAVNTNKAVTSPSALPAQLDAFIEELKGISITMFNSPASSPSNQEMVDRILDELKRFPLLVAAILVQAAKELPETQKLATSVESKLFAWLRELHIMPEEMMAKWYYSVHMLDTKEYARIVSASITSYGDFCYPNNRITILNI